MKTIKPVSTPRPPRPDLPPFIFRFPVLWDQRYQAAGPSDARFDQVIRQALCGASLN
jgi:hypothetical protein